MAYRIAGRNAELVIQTGDREFLMKFDNGVEAKFDVDAIELVADVELLERITAGQDVIYCTAIAV